MGLFDFLKKNPVPQKVDALPPAVSYPTPNINTPVAPSENLLQRISVHPSLSIHEDIKDLLWFGDGPRKNLSEEEMIRDKDVFTIMGSVRVSIGFHVDEPSLIYTRLSIKQPQDETGIPRPPYFPKYKDLTPEQKWIYLKLLSNPYNTDIDIGYVFILYYGLERHLLQGDFDSAFRVILKLRDIHKNKSFQSYSGNAVILSALLKNKGEYVAGFIKSLDKEYEFNFSDNLFLISYYSFDIPLLPKDVMRMAKTFEFTNNNYIKNNPDIFEKCLADVMSAKTGSDKIDIKQYITQSELSKIKYANTAIFANSSIIGNTVPVPLLSENFKLKKAINLLLEEAHEKTKTKLAEMRKAGTATESVVPAPKAKVVNKESENTKNQDVLKAIKPKINIQPMDAKMAAKKYEQYEVEIKELYARRDEDQKYLTMAIKACYEEIEITKYAIPELTRTEKVFNVANNDNLNEMLRDYVQGKNADGSKNIESWASKTEAEKSEDEKTGDAPYLDKNSFRVIQHTLGYHTGYLQLCRIYAKQGNWQEVVELATKAKEEGWYGDWDKRIEKARKKIESTRQ